MTDREHLAAASVCAVALLAFAASWGVVVQTDRADARWRAEAAAAAAVDPAPYAGLVATSPSRRRVVVVRRSRAS